MPRTISFYFSIYYLLINKSSQLCSDEKIFNMRTRRLHFTGQKTTLIVFQNIASLALRSLTVFTSTPYFTLVIHNKGEFLREKKKFVSQGYYCVLRELSRPNGGSDRSCHSQFALSYQDGAGISQKKLLV